MESGDTVTFDDIAGLEDAKQTVQEVVCWPMKRPDLFTGLRRAPNGLLLYGPPGTGTLLYAFVCSGAIDIVEVSHSLDPQVRRSLEKQLLMRVEQHSSLFLVLP